MTISVPVLGHSTKIRRKTDQKEQKKYHAKNHAT